MKQEDFIFNDEPLCNEDDLIDYNKRQASFNWRGILKANFYSHDRKYALHEPSGRENEEYYQEAISLADPEQWESALAEILHGAEGHITKEDNKHMDKPVIDKGIPMPTLKGKASVKYVWVVELEVGDSFEMKDEEGSRCRSLIHFAKKWHNFKLRVRYIRTDEVGKKIFRIWRIE